MSEKCSCYHVTKTKHHVTDFERGYCFGAGVSIPQYDEVGVCYGTMECERCSCGGNESKCDFYPEKRVKPNKSKKTHNEIASVCMCSDPKCVTCKFSIINNNVDGMFSVTDYSQTGSGSASNGTIKVDYDCGKAGNYARYEECDKD